tara:strand:+ start:140 stop:487 length:348 start_codon:yes stop_codon:yes gene_type:complete
MDKVLALQEAVKAALVKVQDTFPMEEKPVVDQLLVMKLRNPLLMVVRAAKALANGLRGEVLVEAVEPDAVAPVVVVDTLVVVDHGVVVMLVEAVQRTTEPIKATKAVCGIVTERL